jgi:hypothetical protein
MKIILYLLAAVLLSAQTSTLYLATPDETKQASVAWKNYNEAVHQWQKAIAQVREDNDLPEDALINFNPDFTAFAVDKADGVEQNPMRSAFQKISSRQ